MLAPLQAVEQTPPHSIEAEQALLGAILNNQDAIAAIDGIIANDDFFEPVHKQLFARFVETYDAGGRIDPGLVSATLGEFGKLPVGDLSINQYVARLAAEATTVINAPDYARIIREMADKRRLFELAETLKSVAAGDQSAVAVAIDAIEALDRIISSRPGAVVSRVGIGDAAAAAVTRMTFAMQNPGRLTGVTWGLHDLDTATGGLQRGDLVIIAGRPGMGRTGLALSSALQSARAGNRVLVFSLEMTAASLADRALSDLCFNQTDRIAYFDISNGHVTNEQAERIINTSRTLRTLPIRIEQQARLAVSQIAARSRKYKQTLERDGKTLDLVLIDHMHIIKPSERYTGNRVGELTEISGGLKTLAKELNVPVIALAQLSRQVENRDDKRPILSDLRDSGSLEQDADVIIFLYREAYYLERMACSDAEGEKRLARLLEVLHQLEANIAKQRNGPTGPVQLFFDIASNAVRDVARRRA